MNDKQRALPAKKGTTETISPVKIETSISAELQAEYAKSVALAEVEGKIILARRFPRDVAKATDRIVHLCKRRKFAEQALYSYPRGGATVEGPSVWFARALAAEWGNLDYGFRVIRDDGEDITLEGYAWDLETNVRPILQASFKNLIYRKREGWIKPDERDKRELVNKQGAILERNCLLKVLRRDIAEDALDLCKATVTSTEDGTREKRIGDLINLFVALGVTEKHVEKWLSEKRGVEFAGAMSMKGEEYRELLGIYNSINDGNSTPGDYFVFDGKPIGGERGKLNVDELQPGDESTNVDHENVPKPTVTDEDIAEADAADDQERPEPPETAKGVREQITRLALRKAGGDANDAQGLINKAAGTKTKAKLESYKLDQLKRILRALERMTETSTESE